MTNIRFKATLEMLVPLIIIDYIVSCYDAPRTMGGSAIAENIDSLIRGIKGGFHEQHHQFTGNISQPLAGKISG